MSPEPAIPVDQPMSGRARQALMVLSTRLRLASYRQPYNLADPEQRAALVVTLRDEFGREFDLETAGVVYLVIVNGEPVVLPEDGVLVFAFTLALARGGRGAADQLTYRTGLLSIGRSSDD